MGSVDREARIVALEEKAAKMAAALDALERYLTPPTVADEAIDTAFWEMVDKAAYMTQPAIVPVTPFTPREMWQAVKAAAKAEGIEGLEM